MLSVRHLTFKRDKELLSDVSFEVAAGEMLTVLGPSGAGKSSLLRCLNRLETIHSGEVKLAGIEVRSLPVLEVRRRMGMVFQTPALVPDTVAANIALGPSLRHETLSESQVEDLLKQVGLPPDFKTRRADQLSLGEQQRVAIAQVLANRPEVLLLDEPTSALDPTAAQTIEKLIRNIHASFHTATVLVTHDVTQALRFNAQTLVIANGRVLARGNIQTLINDTGNLTLQKFFKGELASGEHSGQDPDQVEE